MFLFELNDKFYDVFSYCWSCGVNFIRILFMDDVIIIVVVGQDESGFEISMSDVLFLVEMFDYFVYGQFYFELGGVFLLGFIMIDDICVMVGGEFY